MTRTTINSHPDRPLREELPDTIGIATAGPEAQRIHTITDPYIDTYWLPILGPSSIVLWRRLVDNANHTPYANRRAWMPTMGQTAIITYRTSDLAAALGLARSRLAATVTRLVQSNVLIAMRPPQLLDAGEWTIQLDYLVHRALPDLSTRRLNQLGTRLPALAADHNHHGSGLTYRMDISIDHTYAPRTEPRPARERADGEEFAGASSILALGGQG